MRCFRVLEQALLGCHLDHVSRNAGADCPASTSSNLETAKSCLAKPCRPNDILDEGTPDYCSQARNNQHIPFVSAARAGIFKANWALRVTVERALLISESLPDVRQARIYAAHALVLIQYKRRERLSCCHQHVVRDLSGLGQVGTKGQSCDIQNFSRGVHPDMHPNKPCTAK